ncbi:MAG TPA: tetratricopeptide repeat protein [Croceibacterium sp.]|nr:tetratricopeptide repeat protein [Croceibacterium sp.]
MILRQFFVGMLPRQQAFAVGCLVSALALTTGGCGDNTVKAREEAQIAEALFNQGDIAGAKQAMARALALRDDQLDILLLDARIKSQSGDMRGAYEAYRTILALDPRQPEALLGVAQIGLGAGETERSRDAIETILAMAPGQPDALLLKGIHALNRKDYTEAMEMADQLLAGDENDRRGIVLKARVLALTGRRDEALAMLRHTADTIGNDEMIAIALLENARDEGNLEVMLDQFSLIRQSRQQSVDLAIDETNVRYKGGDKDGARAAGFAILDRFGNDSSSMQRLRNLWREYDPDPLTTQQRAELAQNGALNAQLTAARHYLAQGKPDAALAIIENARDVRALGLRARIAVAADAPRSIEMVAGILGQDTTNCDALAAAAEWNLARNKPNDAIDPAQKSATTCRDSSDGYLLLARAYDELKRPAGAERVYREGVAAHPNDYAITAAYAAWLLRAGRPDAAEAIVDRLTNRTPQRLSSWALLEKTCTTIGDKACVTAAREGAQTARKDFRIDLAPGERASNPLLGQQWR